MDLLGLTKGVKFIGGAASDWLGYWVSNIGDVNADGIEDIFLGAPASSTSGLSQGGLVIVLFGSTTAWSSITSLDLAGFTSGATGFRIFPGTANSNLGAGASAAGDLNGDGIDDFLVCAPQAEPGSSPRTYGGMVIAIFGRNYQTYTFQDINVATMTIGVDGFQLIGAVGEDVGSSVSGNADFNGDGFMDIVLGAYVASPDSRSYAGKAYVIFGTGSLTSNILLSSLATGTAGVVLLGASAILMETAESISL